VFKIFALTFCLFFHFNSSIANHCGYIGANQMLSQSTYSYVNFINRISQGLCENPLEEAKEIISQDCKKVLNGQVFTENRDDFILDLLDVYKNQGPWKIRPAEILVAPSSNTAVLRIFIEMEKCGTYTAIVILRYNPHGLIQEINEVLNKVEGSYDF
jgi:hypothetical protein